MSQVGENRWPNIRTLQRFIDWEKNVPEAQLRVWLVDMYCKGELSTDSDMLRAFTMDQHGVQLSMVGATVKVVQPPEPEPVITYERRSNG